MKTFHFNIIILMLFLIGFNPVRGQNDNKFLKKSSDSYFSTSVNYISDAVFLGRKDSVSAPYLYPVILYHHNSGLYASGSLSYLTKSNQSRVDLYLLTAGIDFNFNKFQGDISATKYFFNDESYNVISDVEGDITAQFLYDFNYINLSFDASTYFNKNSHNDFFLSGNLFYDFKTINGQLLISPRAGIHFGTQYFYEEYYMNNRMGNRKGYKGGNNIQTSIITLNEREKFNIMAIDFSFPFLYTHESLTFTFIPTFVFPKNKSTFVINDEVYNEELKETFYWILGVSYILN
ncbi:MAG: hypothetical protein OEL54_01095 [Flavobacteriaceae bacterium]|nr:hypothetical protein [Flavobacteriaceae bacterium]